MPKPPPRKSTKRQVSTPHPSTHVGMGALPYAGGTSFRVWAPHAEQVYLIGTFNAWAKDATPMAREENGYWSLDLPDVRPGAKYKYRIVAGEQDLARNDPYARAVTHAGGESIVPELARPKAPKGYATPAWNEMIIYELHIGTFNPAPERLPGTFDDAIARLKYLHDLGVNVIEIMPPMEYQGDISWGYNPSQPFAINSSYGGPVAFRRFLEAAHAHGMAVIVDVVYNHFGPDALDLWRFDGWQENDMGGIYFYNDARAKTPWGDTRPDYGRAEVRQYLRDNALMLVEAYDVDGLRFDATGFICNVSGTENPDDDLPDGWSLLQWINAEIDARQPWKITIAEDLRNVATITSAVDEGGAGFNAQWDPAFVYPVRAALATPDDAARDMGSIADAITHTYNDDAFRRIVYTESHDEVANGKVRVPEEIAPGEGNTWYAKKRSTVGAALVCTVPGIPMLFQGQEFLSEAWFDDQQPLDWNKQTVNAGIYALYRDLLALRRNQQQNTRGLLGQSVAVYHVNNEAKILAFHRWDAGGPGDSVVVVVNLAAQAQDDYVIGFPEPGLWQVRFNSDGAAYDPEFSNHATLDVQTTDEERDGLPHQGQLGIGPYSVVILSQTAPSSSDLA